MSKKVIEIEEVQNIDSMICYNVSIINLDEHMHILGGLVISAE